MGAIISLASTLDSRSHQVHCHIEDAHDFDAEEKRPGTKLPELPAQRRRSQPKRI